MERKELGENCLAVLRIMIGWMMLRGFLDKMFGLGFETHAGWSLVKRFPILE